MFWGSNARVLRILSDSVDKLAFYMCFHVINSYDYSVLTLLVLLLLLFYLKKYQPTLTTKGT